MRPLLYAKLTVGLVLVVFAQNPTCPSLCTCLIQGLSSAKRLRTVVCKSSDLTGIPTDLASDTVKFRLERTSVSRIFRSAFSAMPELLYLWLTYNSITVLHPRSFTNLSSLHELRLDGNLLSSFPWEGLRDMPRLRTLGLHNNRLSRIPAFAARYLGNVTYLDLSSNRLSTLANDITTLWVLGDTNLTQRAVVLGLQDNPWHCDCRLSSLLELSKAPEGAVVLLDKFLTCSKPLHLAGVLFQGLELTKCSRPYILTSVTEITAPVGSSILLRCQATGLPMPTLMWLKSARSSLRNQGCCKQTQSSAELEKLPRKLAGYVQASPRLGMRWSIISLNAVSYRDAGEYRCRAQNIAGISEAMITLKVVGVVAEFVGSKNYDQQQRDSLIDYSWRNTILSPKSVSAFSRNMTSQNIPPERTVDGPKTGRNALKRDRTSLKRRTRFRPRTKRTPL